MIFSVCRICWANFILKKRGTTDQMRLLIDIFVLFISSYFVSFKSRNELFNQIVGTLLILLRQISLKIILKTYYYIEKSRTTKPKYSIIMYIPEIIIYSIR